MNENSLVNFFEKQTITSLELLEQINFFRAREGKKKPLRHDTLLNIIRDEFDEEIQVQKILELSRDLEVGNGAIKKSPYFVLTIPQAKQVLLRESKFVRKSVIHRLEELEQKEQLQLMEVPRYVAELETKLKTTAERLETLEKIINKRIRLMVNAELRKRETAQRKANIKEIKKKIVEIIDSKKNRRTAWEKLYKVFSKKYNIDLEKEFIKCVGVYNTKHLTKIEFITTRLKMLNELYEVAKTL